MSDQSKEFAQRPLEGSVTKHKDFIDISADLVLPAAMQVGKDRYARLTFFRHKLNPTSIPSEQGSEILSELTKEHLCSVTISLSAAEELTEILSNVVIPNLKATNQG